MTLKLHSWPAPLQTFTLVVSPKLELQQNGLSLKFINKSFNESEDDSN